MNGEAKRTRLDQRRAPIHEALENFRRMRVVPFDVPGHKRGRGNPELTAFLGQQCVGVDVNSMKPLDNLCHPVSVIREAEELAADAFGAAHAFLMVGGTTSSVQSMVLTACKRGDEIILPRNVHRSVLNALVLCGAVPVYVNEALVTGAGQDDTADGVLIDGLESSLQVSKNLGVQSVEGFRAVDCQDGNGVLDLGSNKGHGKLLR